MVHKRGARRVVNEPVYVVAQRQQIVYQMRAGKARCSRDKNTHECSYESQNVRLPCYYTLTTGGQEIPSYIVNLYYRFPETSIREIRRACRRKIHLRNLIYRILNLAIVKE
jgi:hypothetical protein